MTISLSAQHRSEISSRKPALIAGLGLLSMAIIAPIAHFGILESMTSTGDGATTVANIQNAISQFRIGIGLLFAVAILDVLVAWSLYAVFKPVNQTVSLLAACLRTVYAAIFVGAQSNLLAISKLVSSAENSSELQTQVMSSLNAYTNVWDFGLAVFGLHLLILSYLIFKAELALSTKSLAFAVLVSGLGYCVDSFGKLLLPTYTLEVSTVTFVGEVLLIFWLLWKSRKGIQSTNMETKS